VQEVLSARPRAIVRAVHTSRLPGGRRFEPTRTALVEEPIALASPPDPAATARVVSLSDVHLSVETHAAHPSLLVVSDVHYPGWRVAVDGVPAQLLRTNYVQRGVMVPAGDHTVAFVFRPTLVFVGVTISLATLLAVGAILAFGLPRGEVAPDRAAIPRFSRTA
jgi:hypothetical protein